jgi:hypothetical protein
MKKIRAWMFLLTFLVALPGSFGGGELGNGRTIRLINPLMGVEISYPKNWSELHTEQAISIMSPSFLASSEDTANYSVVRLDNEGIEDMTVLEHYVHNVYPEYTWVDWEFKGVEGFKGFYNMMSLGHRVVAKEIFLISQGVLIEVNYDASAPHFDSIAEIYHSLEWLF